MSALLVLACALVPGSTASAAAPRIAIPACEQAGPCVIVEVVDQGGRVGGLSYFPADQIIGADADITEASYPIKGGTSAVVKPGRSLSSLVATVVPDPGTVTYAEVIRDDDYQRHLLTGPEARSTPGGPSAFTDNLAPAFYSDDPQGQAPQRLTYIRPQRGPNDENGAPGPDQGVGVTAPGGAFLVRVHVSGQLLAVTATATPTDDPARTYTLTSDRAGDNGLTFDWILPGGDHSDEASPTFTFAESTPQGSFLAAVGVSGDDGSFGWGTVILTAGKPVPATPSASPSGPGGSGKAAAGPTKNPTTTKTAASDPRPTAGTATSQPQPSVPSTPLPTAVIPPAPRPSSTVAPRPTDVPTPPLDTAPPTPAAGPADTVSGILLAAAQPLDPTDPQISTEAPLPADAARPLGSTTLQVATVGWVGGGALLLMLGGAASESGPARQRVRRWLRMSQ